MARTEGLLFTEAGVCFYTLARPSTRKARSSIVDDRMEVEEVYLQGLAAWLPLGLDRGCSAFFAWSCLWNAVWKNMHDQS